MKSDLVALTRLYNAYVDTFRKPDGTLDEMMQLKRLHTAFVVGNAAAIARDEGFDAPTRAAALAAALLHDTGRYEQLRRYNTFRDSDSVDHAVFSEGIVREKGWLAGRSDAAAILEAVLYHNRRELPDALPPLTRLAAQTVRDADKLDIFRVLEELIAMTDWRTDGRAFWNLSVMGDPNPAVTQAILSGGSVDYQNIKTLADFVLIQVGWMISGLYFNTTRRLCAVRKHLAFRRDFLHQLTHDVVIDCICDRAAERLS